MTRYWRTDQVVTQNIFHFQFEIFSFLKAKYIYTSSGVAMTSRRIHAHTGPRKQYHWTKETSHWYCRRQFRIHISHFLAPSFGTNISYDLTGLAASFLKKADKLYSLTQCACMGSIWECLWSLSAGTFLV